MSAILGKNCKMYWRGNAATPPLPVEIPATGDLTADYVLLSNVTDAKLDLSKQVADVTTRASGGYKQEMGTLMAGTIEFDMIWNPGDAGFTAIQSVFFSGLNVGMLILDGPIATAGSQGLQANMQVLDFTRDEKLTDAVKAHVKLSIGISVSGFQPTWATMPLAA